MEKLNITDHQCETNSYRRDDVDRAVAANRCWASPAGGADLDNAPNSDNAPAPESEKCQNELPVPPPPALADCAAADENKKCQNELPAAEAKDTEMERDTGTEDFEPDIPRHGPGAPAERRAVLPCPALPGDGYDGRHIKARRR